MSVNQVQTDKEALALRLQEAEDALAAIRSGTVDAFVVQDGAEPRVFTLETADRPYRLLVENMQQGAVTLQADGTIAYCNGRLAELLQRPQENFMGARLADFVSPGERATFEALLRGAAEGMVQDECSFQKSNGELLPAYVTLHALPTNGSASLCVLVTDLTSAKFEEQRCRAAAELAEAQAKLEVELTDTKLLQNISAELVQQENITALYETIIDGAVAIMRSDFASMQQLHPERGNGELRLLAFRGFNPQAAKFWEWVRTDSQSSCSAALRTGQRVIVPDVEQCDFMAGTEDLVTSLQTGIHAVQSTPLFSRSGKLLGIISTHWRKPLVPSERDLRLMDILARQAADIIESKQATDALRRAKEYDEAVMNNMGEGLYTVDDEGLVTFMNPAAERLFGWRLDELRGRKMHDLTHYKHPDGSPFPAEECAGLQVLREGKALTDHEDVFIRKDGTFFDVMYSSSPIRENGVTTGLAVVFRDVTDRKQAEETKARLAAVVESSADAIISKDVTGTITSWNRGAEQLFGYTEQEAIGQPITMLIPADRLNEEPGILERIRRGERLEHYETVRRRKDGTLLDISLTVSPITN